MKLTNSPFKNQFYVYQHFCPKTLETVYVGHGSKGRAWTCGNKGLAIRAEKHLLWIEDLLENGFTPDDFVTIVHKNLTKKEARESENVLIRLLRPVFNKSIRHNCLKFTPALYDEATKLRDKDMSYEDIAKIIGLSKMTIYRGLTGRSISLETALNER